MGGTAAREAATSGRDEMPRGEALVPAEVGEQTVTFLALDRHGPEAPVPSQRSRRSRDQRQNPQSASKSTTYRSTISA